MSNQVISTADLSRIERSLRGIQDDLSYISDQVNQANAEIYDTKLELQNLIQEFHNFVRQDQLDKTVQLSETRLVKVRQEIETKFGHYNDVRRKVTGILQAVDSSLVKKETIENASEEQMINAPRYWLAPCLIALSAWLNDNKELAEKAMVEALNRDPEKTALFFALVTRRAGRYNVSREWLEYYFDFQDPYNLEREIVILIDGFTNGIFGVDARAKTSKKIEAWIQELSNKTGFTEEQRDNWKNALISKSKKIDEKSYTYLRSYSSTWPQLEKSLEGAKLHKIILDYFNDIFSKEVTPEKSIAYAVDALLDTLITNFDDEEIPLRNEERLLTLIIQEDGDKDRAKKLFDSENSEKERINFTELLTNFAMHPEVSNASIATQKFAIALSKEWIKHAHDDLTAENRHSVPLDIDITINQWTGTTNDSSNEQELVESLEQHINEQRDNQLRQMKLGIKHWSALVGGALFTFMGFDTMFLFVLAAFCFIYFFLGHKNLKTKKENLINEFQKLLEQNKELLRATLADVVDYRKEYSEEDQNASLVSEFLESLLPDEYTFSTFDTTRAIIK